MRGGLPQREPELLACWRGIDLDHRIVEVRRGRIYRAGANDDALGVAGLFEIARLFKAAPPPDRTIAFAFWTAEERGLLGSEAYATKPIFPPEKTVANLGLKIGRASCRERVCQYV